MGKIYVEQHDGGYRLAGTRISLDSVVYAFRNGQPAESIVQSFPLLNLEQVYGAIAFYLANQAEIDAYLEQEETAFEAFRKASREADPKFYRRMAAARRQLGPRLGPDGAR